MAGLATETQTSGEGCQLGGPGVPRGKLEAGSVSTGGKKANWNQLLLWK